MVEITEDRQADAAYIHLSDENVHETIEVTDTVSVDLDSNGNPVGVEVLTLKFDLELSHAPNLTPPWQFRFEALDVSSADGRETFDDAVNAWVDGLTEER